MKWFRWTLLGLFVLIFGALAVVYGWSEWIIRHDRGVRLVAIAADRSPVGIAEGARLARINGCLGCHAGGHGQLLADKPMFAVITAPAFTQITARDSDAILARSIRQGVASDGTGLWIMPSHVHLADDDTARIMGYLRTLRLSPQDLPRRRAFGPLARLAMVLGKFNPNVHLEEPAPARRPADIGRYFATVTCLGCHRLYEPRPFDRTGEVAPPLAMMAASYGDADFARLLRTGTGLSKPDLGTMSEVARHNLSALSDAEVAAIHAYLINAAGKAPPS